MIIGKFPWQRRKHGIAVRSVVIHHPSGWADVRDATFGDTMIEEKGTGRSHASIPVAVPKPISEVEIGEMPRIVTGEQELDRLMGGGIMRGSIVLVAGDPGIGKSTLMTELGRYLDPLTILYVSGEESAATGKTSGRAPRCCHG